MMHKPFILLPHELFLHYFVLKWIALPPSPQSDASDDLTTPPPTKRSLVLNLNSNDAIPNAMKLENL